MFKFFTITFIASLFWTTATWAAVTGDKPGLNGTTHIMAYDKNLNTYFKSSYDNWQHIDIDMENLVNLLSLCRYMSKDGIDISGTRPSQGESVSHSVDGVTWTALTKDTTHGWENYNNYGTGKSAWQSVRYGWSDLLALNTPVTARYIRFSWDGNYDSLHEIELNYDHILFDNISFIKDELMPKNTNRRAHIYMDRMSYDANDPVAHVVVSFKGVPQALNPNAEIHLTLMESSTGPVFTKVIPLSNITPQNFQTLNFHTFLDLTLLPLGCYTLEAQIMSGGHPVQNTPLLTIAFTKTCVVPPTVPFPTDGILLEVHKQSHVKDASYPISTGIPFPDGVVNDVNRLALFENGDPVPAQFIVRSTWRPKGGFIRWLGLDFTARYNVTPDENGNFLPRNYRLKLLSQPSPLPKRNLIVPNNSDKITIDTGVIRFQVDKD
ncbi:MAG: discoidin domain-containing protein, partial [Candidatus Brocadia sp.]